MELQDHFPQPYKGFYLRPSDKACIISNDNWQVALKTMKKDNLKNLELNPNYFRCDSNTDLSFLKEFLFIERLSILTNRLNKSFQFEFFPSLRELFFPETNVPIQFDFFRHLKKCGFNWKTTGAQTIFGNQLIETLFVEKYDLLDFDFLGSLINLRELRIGFSRNLVSLNGIHAMKMLQSVEIFQCQNLKDLNDLSGLVNLQLLSVENCKKINSVESIADLANLKTLFYLENGTLPTIDNLYTLTNLEQINLFGTEILDGQLHVLEYLHKNHRLKKINFKNKKYYSHTREQLGFKVVSD
jgi:hypothetical protein